MKQRVRDPGFLLVTVAVSTTLFATLVSLTQGCDGSPTSKGNGGAGGASALGGSAGGKGGGSTASGGHGGSTAPGGHGGSTAPGGHGGSAAPGGHGGGAGGSCAYAGTNHPIGATFPSADDCNSCTCTLSGIACTDRACAPDGGPDAPPTSCVFTTDYRYGPIGGNGLYQDHATLTPPAAYAYVREGSLRADAGTIACAPALPACETAAALDVSDILRDLLHADVQAALMATTPPSYGRDDRPADGTMFQFLRADGRGFLVGSPCLTTDATCVSPPAGITKLVGDLHALDAQQLKDPSCAALQP